MDSSLIAALFLGIWGGGIFAGVCCRLWLWRRKGIPYRYEALRENVFLRNEGNTFPFEKLNESLWEALLSKATIENQGVLYQRVSRSGRINKKRGKKFEVLMERLLQEKQGENPFLKEVGREKWLARDSRVDFFLKWELPEGDKLEALVECKHSVKPVSGFEQLERGFFQLQRYKRRRRSANLLLLVVDFYIPGTILPFSFSRKNNILIINYIAFPIVLDTIADFMFSEVRKRKNKYFQEKALKARFKSCQEEDPFEWIIEGEGEEGGNQSAPFPKNRRKTSPFLGLEKLLLEKLGEKKSVEFSIDIEELRDAIGVGRDKYRKAGKFQPGDFRFHCLKPNLKKIEETSGIRANFWKRKDSRGETLLFKVER